MNKYCALYQVVNDKLILFSVPCRESLIVPLGEGSIPFTTLLATFSTVLFGLPSSSCVKRMIVLVFVVSLHLFLSWSEPLGTKQIPQRLTGLPFACMLGLETGLPALLGNFLPGLRP